MPCLIAAADAEPMGVDPLTAVLPPLGDILVECRMVVTDAQGRVVGADAAPHRFTSSAAPIRTLRTLPTYARVPILMLTTEFSDEMKAKGKAAGANGWLVKPFDPQRLTEVVKKVIG